MKKRLLLKLFGALAIILFFVFSVIEVKNSILFFLAFIIPLVIIRFIEVVCFFVNRKKHIKLGKIEFFNDQLKSILINVLAICFLYLVIKYANNIDIKQTNFSSFFTRDNNAFKYLFFVLFIHLIRTFVGDNRVIYLTDRGLLTSVNYFEDYLWKDFKSYKLIKEQSLIRFTKKNDKFLFVKYEELYFDERNLEITEVLNKNITICLKY